MRKKPVRVLTTGGTIASVRGADGRSVAGTLNGPQLLEQLALPQDYALEVESVLQKPSNALTLADLLVLHARCAQVGAAPDCAGIVITHGTDTLEDTAFFLQSSLPQDLCPIVLTGSQRPPHAPGTDAGSNLAAAIRVAASDAARGAGVLVVFNESIFSASQARKVSSFQLDGFAAVGAGPLGYVDGERVVLLQRPALPTPIRPGRELPRVDVISAALGADPALIRAVAGSGARGLVIEALGRGHVPPDWVPALREARSQGLVIAVTTACWRGPLHPSYDFPGCLQELTDLGILPLSDLPARKARLRLALALSSEDPTAALGQLAATPT